MPATPQIPDASLAEIDALYNAREASTLVREPDACAAAARRALSLGEPLLAYDICSFGIGDAPDHPTLRQLQGLALARSGAHEQAHEVLEKLYSEGYRDEETLGILARIYKDEWSRQKNSGESERLLRRSQALYAEGFALTGGYWTGINAATLALLMGDSKLSEDLATQVKATCLLGEEQSPSSEQWRCATMGEATLLLGDADGAGGWYEKAIRAGAGLGDAASMRRNARLIVDALGHDRSWLERVLPSPVVAVFSGHMIDAKDRESERFPEPSAVAAGEALKARLKHADVRIGYAAAAVGADILFHESLLALGRETHVVLPEPPDQFATRSVTTGQPSWLDRFRTVLDRATSVIVHSGSVSGEIANTYNNWMILGLARLRAKQLEGRVDAFALWDGNSGQEGGTADAVRDWQCYGQQVAWLPPAMASTSEWNTLSATAAVNNVIRTFGSQKIISILFADVAGFSGLADDRIPAFAEYFLGTITQVLGRQEQQPLTRNTWGDGLFLCFSTPRAAGLFALELCDVVRQTDWAKFGLPPGLSVRIALHCGPAYEVMDPVVEQRRFTGAHVNRAARIEPVTPPGSVYSSQSFAALCECEGVREFAYEYVGRMPLAKKFGVYPMFSIRRRH